MTKRLLRKSAALSKSYTVCFDEALIVPIAKKRFCQALSYKKNLINILFEKLKNVKIDPN